MGVVCRTGQTARDREEREEVRESEWRETVREAERRTSARCQKSLRSISQDRDKVCPIYIATLATLATSSTEMRTDY